MRGSGRAWAALFFLAHGAAAEINVGESLDWLVVSHETVAVVGPAGAEALKGKLPAGVGPGGAERLVFFDRAGKPARTIDLAAPADSGEGVAFTASFEVLGKREAILACVKQRVARPVPPGADRPARQFAEPPRGCLRLRVPQDTAAHRVLWAGSACYLLVPADPEYLPGILEVVKNEKEPWARASAAWKLAAYPGEKTESVLQGLLGDPGTAELRTSSGGAETKLTIYPVRQAAWTALLALGLEVREKPEGWYEEFPYSFLH